MKLGLIGTGKQGQRYLMEKNGGRHIVRSGSRDLDDWEGLDGVIIATHPAGHKALALKAIERGLAVLVEKPLALNLADCDAIVSAAEKAGVPFLVAHLDCWAWPQEVPADDDAVAVITYTEHTRDYSPWIDWAPHGLALLMKLDACYSKNVALSQGSIDAITVRSGRTGRVLYSRLPTLHDAPTPMWLAVRDLMRGCASYNATRRIYRALFSEE